VLPGCFSDGRTSDEALQNLVLAIVDYITPESDLESLGPGKGKAVFVEVPVSIAGPELSGSRRRR